MRRVILALFGTVAGLVVLLGFKTHSATPLGLPASVSTAGPGPTGTGSGTDPTATGSSSSSSGAGTSATASQAAASKTTTGDAIDTQYGPVQVQITVTNGKITAVKALVYPTTDPRDAQINSYAIPQLNREVLSAGTASIDMISGATYTSDGYIQSLQSALRKA